MTELLNYLHDVFIIKFDAWVVLGFIAFGLTFMGMMCVLPGAVSHVTHPEPVKVETMAIQPIRETPANAFHVFKSA